MSDQAKDASKRPAEGTGAKASSAPAAGNGPLGVRVRVDHPNRELYVSTTRAVAGVSVASFCGLLIGVVALSRSTSHTGPQAARASADAAKQTAVAVPVVAAKPAAAVKPVQVAVANGPGKPAPLITSTPSKQAAPTTAPVAQAAAPATQPAAVGNAAEGRVIGQTYFVFGSFPKSSDAKAAAARLREQGVNCSVERNLAAWTHKGWYSVVSVKGFTSSKDAACQQELKALRAKELEPHPYRWRTVQGA